MQRPKLQKYVYDALVFTLNKYILSRDCIYNVSSRKVFDADGTGTIVGFTLGL